MLELKWHIAEVIDIDEKNAPPDPKDSDTKTNNPKLGRVQVKLLMAHREVDVGDANQKQMLPWARPFMHSFPTSFNPPAVGSKVWVVCLDEFYKNIMYLNNLVFNVDVPLETLLTTDFKDFPSNEAGVKLNVQFPQFRFFKLPNGSVFFFDTVTKELGVWHSAGAFIMFSADGSITVRTNGKVDIKSDGQVKVESGANVSIKAGTTMPLEANGVHLGQLIIDLATVVGKTINGANYMSPVGPCTSPLIAEEAASLAAIKTGAAKFKG